VTLYGRSGFAGPLDTIFGKGVAMLRIEGLAKRYKTGDHALKGVSFEVAGGQVVGLIGPSGAGKSTLIRCVNRLVEPTSGSVVLNDRNLTNAGGGELRRSRRRIGMIFQEYALVERLTVMENVLSGRLGYVPFWRSFLRRFPQADVDKAFSLLDRVGLGDHADKRADALSGGQRQRVGIARALEQDPELLLVDEPTASLDPKTSRQIMRLILEICRERGLPAIINIHDVALARMFVDRIIGLRAGEVVFDAEPALLDDAALTRIYGEEDWKAGENASDDEPEPVTASEPARERMAGLV
jgi:phosphonate transport system ATP-binding protein